MVAELLNKIWSLILGLPGWLMEFIKVNMKPLTQIVVIPGIAFILLFAIVTVWFERKYLARAMLRVGPYYAGGRAGWLQLIADFLKLFVKELTMPEDCERFLLSSVPILLPTVSAAAVALIPFASDWVLFRAGGIGMPLFFAILGLVPFFPLIAGWAANNKYTIIGSFRTAYLYVAAEIPLIICAAAVAIMAGSFDLIEIAEAQSSLWFAIPQFIGFVVFFIGLMIEVERTPFDIPVAEQELVVGWRTEYSGILFGFTMMAEYVLFLAWMLLFVTLYLGGYQGPVIFGSLSPIIWVLIKLSVLESSIILLRTVFPRVRMDQSLKIGWYYLTPLAILNLFIVLAMKFGGLI